VKPKIGDLVEFDRDVDHGDWKTASVRPNRWPTIKKGTQYEVVGFYDNFYGQHVRVKHATDTYDIEMHRIIKVITPPKDNGEGSNG
jgi:hypothetical protein